MRRLPALQRRRHPQVLQRSGELHTRRPLHAGRGAGAETTCSSPPGSTRSASSRRAAPARCWPSGSSAAIRRWTCGTSTSAGCIRSSATSTTCRSARRRPWDCSMRCTGRTSSTRPARGVRLSPLHERLKASGACFGETAGSERPNWFAPTGVEPVYRYSYKRQNWFPYAAAEHKAVREAVALFDMTSFAKFRIEGRDAERVLQSVSANDVGGPAGRVDLHPVAQRAWRHRGRSHRNEAGTGPVSRRHRRRHRPPGSRMAATQHCERRRRGGVGRQRPAGRAERDGPATRARCSGRYRVPIYPTPAFRSRPRARSRSPEPRSGPRASPTSASSAGSSTCRRLPR